jgi:hypothetical protein
MNSEDRHAEGLERAQVLLAQLQANQAIPARTVNTKRKTKKKKKSRKGEQDTAPKDADTRGNNRDDPPETTEPSDDKLPDEFEKGEEEDPLLEGEKVEIIDPNEE